MKVSFEHINKLIGQCEFSFHVVEGTTTTACWVILPNGFQIGYGESACVDPTNYNQELGERYAFERAEADATNNLWKLEGYLLAVTGNTSDHWES